MASGSSVGAYNSLAVDASDRPHISYYDDTNDDLKYAYHGGPGSAGTHGSSFGTASGAGLDQGWQIETVDAGGAVGWYTSLALDADDYPRISYYDVTNGNLKYASYDGLGWQIDTVDATGTLGWYTSLALDAGDSPHISYYSATSGDLKYAYHGGSGSAGAHGSSFGTASGAGLDQGWQIETVDSAGSTGQYTSLALDVAGHPHISYYDPGHDDLRYAYHGGSGWQTETVDSEGPVGQYCALAIDSAGRSHVSYQTASGDLKYARRDGLGQGWQMMILDGAGYVGEHTSLAVDAGDFPHISYYNATDGDLRYAYYDGSLGQGRGWQTETVDITGTVGLYTSLALDASDHPHISYYDASNGDLRYAYYDGSSEGTASCSGRAGTDGTCLGQGRGWQIETADGSSGNVGLYTSLALDAADHPHISYYDVSQGDLQYAYWDGTHWQTETVDVTGTVGLYTSLALDASGHPHVSYYDAGNGDLKYAYHDGQAWHIETIDSVGDVGRYTSLALDAAGLPYISYADDSGLSLKVAYYDGLAWQVDVVNTTAAGISYTSLALDPSTGLRHAQPNGSGQRAAGLPQVSYYNLTMGNLKYATMTCLAISGVRVGGPTLLLTGETGVYTATLFPLTATPPTTITWGDGTSGPTATYSWTLPGSYTIAVTAVNPCGQSSGSLVVQVCQPVLDVQVQGPVDLLVGETAVFSASFTPITATAPVTITWDNGTVGPTAAYSWTQPGSHTVVATGTNDCSAVSGSLVVQVCQPVLDVPVQGPADLWVGETAVFSASFAPITATAPVTITWDNGTSGPTATYSWTVSGIYTITVTASNDCGLVQTTFPVTVVCQPVEDVVVTGPAALPSGQEGIYQAIALPITASAPLTFTWDNGAVGPTAVYSWTQPGSYTLAVTARNDCGEAQGTYSVTVFCQPAEAATIAGPAFLSLGWEGTYQAEPVPITASLPMTFTWHDGTVGPTAVFSWTVTGTYGLAVTATNACGQGHGALSVTVFCQEMSAVLISGPVFLPVGWEGTYQAEPAPITASLPITYTWFDGTVGPMAVYSWTQPGTYTLTISATNPCGGAAYGDLAVEVGAMSYEFYLPLIVRGG